ncbi:MAG: sulfate adenylyltransferase subunit CysN [Myxococcales bacterium]|nr:sulfate adenylyltransferase subunit CysN [Myxococcales bacterium]
MDLLRFSTAGSVDDGKSTLIGRLLYDSKNVFEDQLEAVARSKVNRASQGIDLSLLTDGLRAEREQGITIDVAYRYFSTPRRKFIIADTPGHEQYTRNMATGASTAHLAIVLIDARYGALVQSRRHTFIASLLGIPHVVIAVNKMDLVGFDEGVWDRIRADFAPFVAQLGFGSGADTREATWIPLSALLGDNVVDRSVNMPWYRGPSLLEHLEAVDVAGDEGPGALRFPVQYVVRPDLDFRGFAGQIASGVVRRGDAVVCLPAGTRSTVARIHTYDGDLEAAGAPRSVTLLLADEIDVSRGDMLVHADALPWVRTTFDADVVWMANEPLDPSRPYVVKHTTRSVRGRVTRVRHRVDVNSLAEVPADCLQLNEIGRLQVTVAQPLYLDAYRDQRRTGAFILIDPLTNATVAAGMVAREQPDAGAGEPLRQVDRAAREAQNGHKSAVLWLAAPPGELRTAVARALEARLFQRGVQAFVVDNGHANGICSAGPNAGREPLSFLLGAFMSAGVVLIADVDMPDPLERAELRRRGGSGDVLEVELVLPAGPHAEWQASPLPDARIEVTGPDAVEGAVARIVAWLGERGLFGAPRVVSPGAGI